MLNVVIFILISKRNINLNIGRKSYKTTSRGGSLVGFFYTTTQACSGVLAFNGESSRILVFKGEVQGKSSNGSFKEHGIYR